MEAFEKGAAYRKSVTLTLGKGCYRKSVTLTLGKGITGKTPPP